MAEKTDWKAISIMQPWSHLVVTGLKDIENRSRPTSFRGHVLIHAGKNLDDETLFVSEGKLKMFSDFRELLARNLIYSDILKFTNSVSEWKLGGIVGIAEIVDCVTHSTSPWFFGKYGYVIKNARPLPFVPCRGALGFFDVPPEVIEALKAAKVAANEPVRN